MADQATTGSTELVPGGAAVGLLSAELQADLLDALDDAARRYLGERARPNTRRAYLDDWRAWTTFTAYLGVHPDTARLGLMVAFVEWLRRQQAAPATIDRRLSGVTVTLTEHGIDVPRQVTRAARAALAAYRRELADQGVDRGRGQAVPVRVAHLRAICLHLDSVLAEPNLDLRQRLLTLRDKALLLLGFGLAARRSELAGLHAVDVVPSDDGLLVTVRASKSSTRPATVPILAGTVKSTCPLRAWRAWDAAAREHAPGRDRAFVDFDGRTTRLTVIPTLTPRDVYTIITNLDQDSGVHAGLAGHSLRAGLATEARRAGHDFKTIAAQGRWSDKSTEPYRYMRIVDAWEDNATAGLGL